MKYICNDKCLIYLLSCTICGQEYVGNITDRFRSRWNNHKKDVRNVKGGNMENVKPIFFQRLLLQNDQQGFLENVEVRLTDKTQDSDTTQRGFYWMRTLGTFYPDGINL